MAADMMQESILCIKLHVVFPINVCDGLMGRVHSRVKVASPECAGALASLSPVTSDLLLREPPRRAHIGCDRSFYLPQPF